MRIGILGGTFNPIHKGHIYLAKQALKELNLDKVIFVPPKITPLRDEKEIIDSEERFRLVQLAIEDNDKFEASSYEIDKGGISYTIDTLKAFRDKFDNKTELFFIIGSDVADELDKWKDFDNIRNISNFVIARCPNFKLPKIDKDIITFDINALDISSSEVRRKIKNNENFKDLAPDKVYQYIKKKGLYKD